MPYTRNLEGWLGSLDLRGTRDLHTFNSHKTEEGLLRGQTFAFLKDVSFHYHAHCCQLKRSNYSYYERNDLALQRKRETSLQGHIFQRLYNYFFGGSRSSEHPMASDGHQLMDRYKRHTIPDENATDNLLTCLNYTDLNIILSPDSDTIENDIREANNSTVLPEEWFFDHNSADLICTYNEIVNITTHVYRPCADANPSPVAPSQTVSATPDISPTPTTIPTNIIPISSPLSTVAMSEMSTPAPIDSATPTACSSSIVKVFCMLTTVLTPPPPTMPPTTPAPVSCICSASAFVCSVCENSACTHPVCATVNSCSMDCRSKRRRRHTTEGARLKRESSDALLSEGWFYPNPDNTNFSCILVSENTTTDLPMTTASESSTATTVSLPQTSTSTNTDTNVGMPVCRTELYPLDGSFRLHELSTDCSPLEDPFNPCEDLLGKDHVLRSFIWIVIILALVGNSLVIIVFFGYSVITKRTNVELFVVHFFYFNLAVADFLMGIYLFTIAIQDLRTLGNFSQFDIAWRTEGGCDFAGFCAITSTMVSVYVLLVITVERLYTFSRALQNSHTSKITAVILMAIGWGFGILVGILPVIADVNDYSRTAICLPFDVSSKLALSYILFLLLFTGVVFTAIAICYIIIFYQVFYRQKATINSVSDRRRWKTELKVALRMGTLVLTNFICWFPIALLGISAAVGNSLVNNINFAKWVMVFIFPVNACLNPILYSILSKVFRDNLVLILGKCGLCGRQVSKIRRRRAGFTPSVTSNRSQVSSEAGLVSESRRGTIIERFRNFSITSTTNLLGRRGSTMSQVSSEERYQIDLIRAQRRRSSEYSSGSSEDILGVKVNSRRGSAFSGGSVEEMTTFSNPGFRSSSPVGGSTVADGVTGNHKGSPRPRISLGAVPEENENLLYEIPVAPEQSSGEDKQNGAYLDNETEDADTSAIKDMCVYGNGIITGSSQVVNQLKIIDSETEKDSVSGATGEHDSSDHKKIAVAGSDSSPLSTDSDHYVHEIISVEFD